MKTSGNTFQRNNRRHFPSRSLRAHVTSHRQSTVAEVSPQIASTGAEVISPAVSKLLFTAQEEERARIARELHDGIGQELALLMVNMQCLPDVSESDTRMNEYLLKMRLEAEKICNMVRTVSHDLHPPELDYLGLKVALESLCRRFSSGWKIAVHYTCSTLPFTPSQAVSLAIYRVLQEALQNIAKHSGARTVKVELTTTQTDIFLFVSDNGHGFDIKEVRRGVGLQSMKERIASLGGAMNIYSRLGSGTKIEFRVPLVAS